MGELKRMFGEGYFEERWIDIGIFEVGYFFEFLEVILRDLLWIK